MLEEGIALTPETTQQRSPEWFAIRSSLKVTGSIDCTGADQHLLFMCPLKWTQPTFDAANMKHLMTFQTSLAFEHISTLARKRRGIICHMLFESVSA